MAGTLTISTLSDGTNSTSSTNRIQGSAKAWVRFNGATASINGSYNVSSITRSGTGQYIVNMTNALADANYAVALSTSTDGTASTSICAAFTANIAASNALTTPTTTSFVFSTVNNAYLAKDGTFVSAVVYR
jgi:hypothetical protein